MNLKIQSKIADEQQSYIVGRILHEGPLKKIPNPFIKSQYQDFDQIEEASNKSMHGRKFTKYRHSTLEVGTDTMNKSQISVNSKNLDL
jgi:hypothetical protein